MNTQINANFFKKKKNNVQTLKGENIILFTGLKKKKKGHSKVVGNHISQDPRDPTIFIVARPDTTPNMSLVLLRPPNYPEEPQRAL